MNKTIVNGLKKRLEEKKGNWAKELPNVLWAFQTTLRMTLFSMTYEAGVVIQFEINLSSIRVADFSRNDNDTQMVGNLDSLEERRDMISVGLADYH